MRTIMSTYGSIIERTEPANVVERPTGVTSDKGYKFRSPLVMIWGTLTAQSYVNTASETDPAHVSIVCLHHVVAPCGRPTQDPWQLPGQTWVGVCQISGTSSNNWGPTSCRRWYSCFTTQFHIHLLLVSDPRGRHTPQRRDQQCVHSADSTYPLLNHFFQHLNIFIITSLFMCLYVTPFQFIFISHVPPYIPGALNTCINCHQFVLEAPWCLSKF